MNKINAIITHATSSLGFEKQYLILREIETL